MLSRVHYIVIPLVLFFLSFSFDVVVVVVIVYSVCVNKEKHVLTCSRMIPYRSKRWHLRHGKDLTWFAMLRHDHAASQRQAGVKLVNPIKDANIAITSSSFFRAPAADIMTVSNTSFTLILIRSIQEAMDACIQVMDVNGWMDGLSFRNTYINNTHLHTRYFYIDNYLPREPDSTLSLSLLALCIASIGSISLLFDTSITNIVYNVVGCRSS